MSNYQYCFWDLDGTLTDSAPGITHSVRYAMEQMGKPLAPDHDLRCFIGPPLLYSFENFLGLSPADSQRAVDLYRVCYRAGAMLECNVYDGVREVLAELNRRGIVCVLATCKPHEFANNIIKHFDLAKYFAYVSGPEMDGTRNEKHEVIEYALQNLGIPSPNAVLMVGDRRDDVVGAKKCNMDCVGVAWGFGTREELDDAGAKEVIAKPQELLKFFEK
jgi:phosphoglycolate phosphatase